MSSEQSQSTRNVLRRELAESTPEFGIGVFLCWPDKFVQFLLFFLEGFGLDAFPRVRKVCQMVNTLEDLEK